MLLSFSRYTGCYPFHQPSPGNGKLKDIPVSATRYQHLEDFWPNERLECTQPLDLIAGNLQDLVTAMKHPNPRSWWPDSLFEKSCNLGPFHLWTARTPQNRFVLFFSSPSKGDLFQPCPTPSQRLTCHPSPQPSWVWLTKQLGKVIKTHLSVVQYLFHVVFHYGCALCFTILVLITQGYVMPS